MYALGRSYGGGLRSNLAKGENNRGYIGAETLRNKSDDPRCEVVWSWRVLAKLGPIGATDQDSRLIPPTLGTHKKSIPLRLVTILGVFLFQSQPNAEGLVATRASTRGNTNVK